MARIWVYVECVAGAAAPVALELLTHLRTLGDTVEAVVLDPDGASITATLGAHGAERVYLGTDQAYRDRLAQPAADTLSALIEEHRPDLVVFGATYDARDVCGRVSARTGSTVVANGTGLRRDGEQFVVESAIFGATVQVQTRVAGGSPCVLIRPRSFAAEAGPARAPAVTLVASAIRPEHQRARRLESVSATQSGPKLEDAAIVISGGRGLQDPANFQLLERIAELVRGAVGASRAVVDAGWAPYARQVGQTGKTVKPTVYIACGISGAMQHTVGMKAAAHIVAINTDPDAPIFKLADLGVVGDTLTVLPAMIQELERRDG